MSSARLSWSQHRKALLEQLAGVVELVLVEAVGLIHVVGDAVEEQVDHLLGRPEAGRGDLLAALRAVALFVVVLRQRQRRRQSDDAQQSE